MRFVSALVLSLLACPSGADDAKSRAPAPSARRPINRAFRGRVVELKKRTLTLFYDFEDARQLEDFEEARPPRLLDASRNVARVEGGRLVLEGSTSIRHRIESAGKVRARFTLNFRERNSVGAVVTEPTLGDFYLVYNLFDRLFNRNGAMHIGACGLREDEGAEDHSSGLVNFRDVFGRDLKETVAAGRDTPVEVSKEGWDEFFRVGEVKGRGSSRGKTREMKTLLFGLFVHRCSATFDDLTITFELSDAYLEYENLEARVVADPLEGVADAPAAERKAIEDYVDGRCGACDLIALLGKSDLPHPVRCAAAKALAARKDPKAAPPLLDALAADDLETRRLSAEALAAILGRTLEYAADAPPEKRAASVEKIRALLERERARYY